MAIAKLSPLLVNQIAAGEVIERPASVVKELVENALDAGASRIDVAIEEGGRQLIRVADDGCGIDADELPLALEAHATSKIRSADDLEAIVTLGFRGEALASIASVSRLRLTSRTRDAEAGAVVEATGDERADPRPEGCAAGTVVEVRQLFCNTPARRKFMRAASTEFGHINATLTRLAMAHPAVGFKLTHGPQRPTFDLPPDQSPRQRCLALLGEELAEAMLEITSHERGVKLWGLAGKPQLARATTKYQFVYVNGRPIRDRGVMHAIKEAYRGLIEPSAQPMVVLFIEVAPRDVDVNVHPTKSEVRFADGNVVHGQVLAAVRQRLLGSDLTPAVHVTRPGGGGTIALPSIDPAQLPLGLPDEARDGAASDGDDAASMIDTPRSADAFVDYFRRMDPTQKGFVYQQVKREMDAAGQDHDDDQPLTELLRPSATPILQVHNSYLVTQDEQGIVIIDQHALHERMMFERLVERIQRAGQLESQRLITPVVLSATPARLEALEQLQPLLKKVGVEAGPMGPRTIAIHAFATLLFDRHVDPAEFLTDLLDRVEDASADDGPPSEEAALHEVLDMMSCKAAIKAGDALQPDELSELLSRRTTIERASNCPHGRPTTVRLTLRDLEKHFKRT